ncbi:MAG: 2-oxoacid ferredoxin oxidoreductase, partial [Candidatus Atribacteria bacterium]|nr:2-oxoacid ferredoxin oxidoreductase [Candidatus Atribacteria bacterium]
IRAFEKSLEWGDKIPLGILYSHLRPVYSEKIEEKTGRKNFLYRQREGKEILKAEGTFFQ